MSLSLSVLTGPRVRPKAKSALLAMLRAFWWRDYDWVGFWSGVVLLWWGWVDLTSAAPLSASSFLPLLVHVRPHVLEGVAIAIGLSQVIGAIGDDKRLKCLSALMAGCFMGMLVTCFAEAPMEPKGGIAPWGGWALGNAIAMVRCIADRHTKRS